MPPRTLHLRTPGDVDRLPEALRAQVIAARRAERDKRRARDAVEGGVCAMLRWYRPTTYQPVAWQEDIGAVCDGMALAAVEGRAEWHMLGAPPRHGKSEHVGRAMGPRAMALRPGLSVLYLTSTEERAIDVSQAARGMVTALYKSGAYPHLAPGVPWKTTEWRTVGGNHWVGLGEGSATGGIGAHMIIPDDITGSDDRQASRAWKLGARRWFQGDALTRDAGGAVVCLMETRRGLDDMQGWASEEWPGRWQTHAWRCQGTDGSYLWPERYGATWHAGRPDLAPGTRVWETQYQQRPYREGGSVLLEAWLRATYPGDPMAAREDCARVWVAIDPAAKTAERNDPSAILVAGVMPDRSIRVLHVEAERRDYPALRQRVRDVAAWMRADGILVEDTSVGQALIPDLRLMGLAVRAVSVAGRGDKVQRMAPQMVRWASGQVQWPDPPAPWCAMARGQLAAVPDSDHDDVWDAFSILLAWESAGASTSLWDDIAAGLR